MSTKTSTEDTVRGILQYLKNLPVEDSKKILQILGKKAPAKKGVLVTSAVALNQEEKEQIGNFVIKNGYQLEDIRFEVESSMLGGLKIRLGDNLIDKSLSSLLAQYRSKLT